MSERIAQVPTLDELAERPERAAGLPRATIHAMMCRAMAAQQACFAALLAERPSESAGPTATPDQAITLEVAAERLGVVPKTLAAWTRHGPWDHCVIVRTRNRILLSAARFDQLVRETTAGSPMPAPARGRERKGNMARPAPHHSHGEQGGA